MVNVRILNIFYHSSLYPGFGAQEVASYAILNIMIRYKVYVMSSTKELVKIHNMYFTSSKQELVEMYNRQSRRSELLIKTLQHCSSMGVVENI